MKSRKTYTVPYRRKRQSKTNYKKRLKLLQSEKPRLVIRKSLRKISAMVIEYSGSGDKTIATANSLELASFGWNYNPVNTPSAYLVGLLIGKKAKEKGITEVILDMGLSKPVPGCRIYSVLKGALDSGLSVPHSDNVLPSEERVQGKHIEDYAKNLKGDENKYNKKFGGYNKNKVDPMQITNIFNEVKKKLAGN